MHGTRCTPCGGGRAINGSYRARSTTAAVHSAGPTISKPRWRARTPTRAGRRDWPSTAAAICKPTPFAVCASPSRSGVVAMSDGKMGANDTPINASPRQLPSVVRLAAVPGEPLSDVISIRYILGFRKDLVSHNFAHVCQGGVHQRESGVTTLSVDDREQLPGRCTLRQGLFWKFPRRH